MKLAFDEVKATQAGALFLKLADRPLNYMGLIKLLYRADREAIRRWGLPITTDKYASMHNGPVTSRIYDQIKASANASAHPTFWATYITRSSNPRDVVLVSDPGVSELSRAEEKLIAEVFAADGDKDRFDLVNECHRDFPEWQDPGPGKSIPLDIADIINALGLSEEEAARVANLIEVQRASHRLAV